MQLLQGDCLELMKDIPDGSIDMILCDLPYGTTKNKWDSVIDLGQMWNQYKRIIKPNGCIALFAQNPFGAELICSNRKMFRYELIWEKTPCTGFLNANRMPLRAHENILVFYKKLPTYNPQMEKGKLHGRGGYGRLTSNYGNFDTTKRINADEYYPRDIMRFRAENCFGGSRSRLHPTQKPVPLLEYLIKTYTDPGQVVLDNCMGSGSTGVACVNTGRDFIGIELDPGYFETAKNRIEKQIAEKASA